MKNLQTNKQKLAADVSTACFTLYTAWDVGSVHKQTLAKLGEAGKPAQGVLTSPYALQVQDFSMSQELELGCV